MGTPTYVAGEVWTAAYANSIGMHLVKTQTIGSAVSTVAVTSVFSADYDNYLITINGGSATNDDIGRMVLGATATGYYGVYSYATYAAPGTYAGVGDNNAVRWSYAWRHTTTSLDAYIILRNPYLSEITWISGVNAQTTLAGRFEGILNNTTSYTDFTISPNTGTITGGTIRVYGFRNSLT